MGGSRGESGGPNTLENHKLLYVPLTKTGTDPLVKKLDPLGPIASRGRSVRPSVKFVDD